MWPARRLTVGGRYAFWHARRRGSTGEWAGNAGAGQADLSAWGYNRRHDQQWVVPNNLDDGPSDELYPRDRRVSSGQPVAGSGSLSADDTDAHRAVAGQLQHRSTAHRPREFF